jgi:hypothetical protein
VARKPFEAKYTDEQRAAVVDAYEDRKIQPASRVRRLAQAGELSGLEPFDMPESQIRYLASQLRKKRAGLAVSKVGDMPHRDGIEALRRRLMSAADWLVTEIEHDQAKRGKTVNRLRMGEELRQAIRCVREAAALPGPQDPRPVAPGARIPNEEGRKNGGATQGGIADSIVKAHHASPAQDAQQTQTHTENSTGTREAARPTETQADAVPGSRESNVALPALADRMALQRLNA